MDKASLYPDLESIAAVASYKQIFDLFYTLARLRYATFKQLHPLNHRVVRENLLVKFTELGYLDGTCLVKNDIAYHITPKTRELLTKEGYNTNVLQKDFTGLSLKHALKITDCLLKLQGEQFFYSVFYPTFQEPPEYTSPFLRPDACVVWKKDGAYKIQFLEVESEKPDWEHYLLVKRQKYEQLASDQNIYRVWWKYYSQLLNLPMGNEADFCFSVVCHSVKKLDYNWPGWTFTSLDGI